jgi:hypothetical protein
VGACSPTDFIKETTQLFIGVTCDHSLGGSQVVTMFYKYLFKKGGAPGGPGCSKSTQNGQNFLLSVSKPAKTESKQKQKMAKNTLEMSLVISRKAPKLTK